MFVRVVLDTNVLISAVLNPDGLEAGVVNAVLGGTLEAWITAEMWAEYEEVFARRKFAGVRQPSREMLDGLLRSVRETSAVSVLTVALDDDDNRFLECAEAAQANFLVTGNRRHYPENWGQTRVVKARDLIGAVAAAGMPFVVPEIVKDSK